MVDSRTKEYRQIIETQLPKLKKPNYKETSPHDPNYNCIAYAAGDQKQWWEPFASAYKCTYWPSGVDRDMRLETLRKIFQSQGFTTCASAKREKGFDKVALYGRDGEVLHAAKQLPDGKWSSKLGEAIDIRHDSASAVSSGLYGEILEFMRRAKS